MQQNIDVFMANGNGILHPPIIWRFKTDVTNVQRTNTLAKVNYVAYDIDYFFRNLAQEWILFTPETSSNTNNADTH